MTQRAGHTLNVLYCWKPREVCHLPDSEPACCVGLVELAAKQSITQPFRVPRVRLLAETEDDSSPYCWGWINAEVKQNYLYKLFMCKFSLFTLCLLNTSVTNILIFELEVKASSYGMWKGHQLQAEPGTHILLWLIQLEDVLLVSGLSGVVQCISWRNEDQTTLLRQVTSKASRNMLRYLVKTKSLPVGLRKGASLHSHYVNL